MHRAAAFAAFLAWAAALTACAGPLDRRAFDRWTRYDAGHYAARHADLSQAAEPREASRPDSADDLPHDATLDDLIAFAVRRNPELEAAFYRWRAALERVPQARALPDPQASFGLVLDEVDADAQYMGERYSISQMFPWFGKLERRGDMALEAAHAEAQRFEAARLRLIEQVAGAWYEYAYLHRAAAVAAESQQLLARLESVTRARYRAGEVTQADVLRAQVELSRLEDQARSLADMLGPAAAELNAALGRPAHAPLPAAPPPSRQTIEPLPRHSDEHWLVLARQANPELAAARHDAAEQRQAIALARKDYFPDVMLSIEYARDASARMAMMDGGGADMLVGMVSVNLPIWRQKYDAAVREALARFGQATRRIESQQNDLDAGVKRALFAHRDAGRKLDLYGQTLLPRARQALATTEAAYRAGDAGFSDLIDAQRVLLEFELARERSAADLGQAAARVRTLVGQRDAHAEPDGTPQP